MNRPPDTKKTIKTLPDHGYSPFNSKDSWNNLFCLIAQNTQIAYPGGQSIAAEKISNELSFLPRMYLISTLIKFITKAKKMILPMMQNVSGVIFFSFQLLIFDSYSSNTISKAAVDWKSTSIQPNNQCDHKQNTNKVRPLIHCFFGWETYGKNIKGWKNQA